MPPFDTFFHIPELDPAVRKSFRREQLSELTLPLATSLMEGGFVAVVAAKAFNVEPWVIAVISAAPMFGNLSSFVWTRIATGRSKIPMVVALQTLVLLCVAAIAVSPRSQAGAWILLASVVLCRMLITGIITVRSVAWSLNYDRALRARATGRLQAITSLTVVLTTSLAGLVLDAHPENFRWIYGAGAVFGGVGVWLFRGVLVRGEKRHRVMERRGAQDGRRRDGFFEVLRKDSLYARYQLHQFISGTANMMLEPPLVYLVTKQLGASYVVSIGIVMLIPFTLNLTTMPLWARYLDKVHVTEFRARQNAGWVIGVLIMFWGAWTFSLWWLALGRVITGIVNGGGSLAWQLGHNDFAPRDQISTYMGIHVTLTGVRGAFAPFLGMALYLGWDAKGYVPGSTGLSAWVFLLSALLGLVAWRGFDTLRKDVRLRPLNR
ncbi:MAG: MFS transporter [Burkholderiaceae bacterium]|nr:MFS transporter [Rhodoferax sp.]MCB2006316.1 MFS transporter [Rhodoferax sp.]MCP5261256.1 MFS transporter [Rhodoferax sp.]